jgi:hypothetical protein
MDAALVLLTADGDWVLTADAGDIQRLAVAAGRYIDVVPV